MLRRSVLTLGLALLLAPPASARDEPVIAAAADLRHAMDSLVRQFRAETGLAVRPVYGSSGQFYQQLAAGAPFQLFLSADESYVQKLARAGRTMDDGQLYAIGRIVLVAPSRSRLALDPDFRGLRKALASGELSRFAIANPDHAPYGVRAREALQSADLWTQLEPRLVYGENVAQALQFALSGGADGGIVALSLVLGDGLKGTGRYVLIPEEAHKPLRQRMVLMKGAGATARRFHDWLQTPSARRIFRKYGFVLPGEAP